jgi:long-chain acyl-CoA synthetase
MTTFEPGPQTIQRPVTYAETLRCGARRAPDAVALICGDERRTWRQLLDRSAQVAQAMLAYGVRPQDRVAFVGRNCLEFFEILFGASMVGAVPTGVNWRLAPDEMLVVVNDTRAQMLFIERPFVAHLLRARGSLDHVTSLLVIDGEDDDPPPDGETFEQWLSPHPPIDPDIPAAWDDVAMQTYTSGTTGGPKGVMHTVAAIAATLANAEIMEISESSVALIATPVFHATATGAVAMVLSAGGRCVIARDADPDTLLPLIERERVTLSIVVPTIIKMLIDSPRFADYDLTSIRSLIYTAAPISRALLTRARAHMAHVRFIQVYGSTETLGATILGHEDHVDHLESAGRPLPGVTIRLVDPASGEAVPPGATGEVWVSAPSNMAGYWDRPDETARAMVSGGFVRTGDLGRFDGEFLVLHDRLNDMIISGAENVYPTEVESVLTRHPLIDDVAIVGVPSDHWGETVLAFVVPRGKAESQLSEEDVIAFARANLATYKCPSAVRFLDALPRNASGKVLKTTLREPFWQTQRRRIG